MSPFFVALERGYFREAGIDARPQFVVKAPEAVALLSAGRLDAALTSVQTSLLNAVAQGAEVRVVLGRDVVTPSCGDTGAMYARASSFPDGTSDVKKWTGKKFWCGGFAAGLGEFLLDTILRSAGLDPRQTPRAEIGVAEAAAALASGAIDAMVNANNLALNFGARPGIVRETAGATAIAGLQYSHILAGRTLLGDPSLGGAFLACFLRGLRDFQAGATPQFLRDLVRTQGRDPAVLTECRDYYAPDGRIDLKSLQACSDWAAARGYVASPPPIEKCVDMRHWEIARKTLDS
jgi:ABC-type nitrate/sulfonate/bicarbonate transport system substrate-binding protein